MIDPKGAKERKDTNQSEAGGEAAEEVRSSVPCKSSEKGIKKLVCPLLPVKFPTQILCTTFWPVRLIAHLPLYLA
jgi:hypothetical protein